MATRSEENRRKQQALINAGYRGVVADGSWGPYQQKLWLHYLANSLGPTKQQRIDRAKQNNQREAQIARNYFSQTPSIGNLARGVYHWWNSVPALGGQNESGVQEYNVASNPIVAAASPTKFNPKTFAEGWKNAGSFMNRLRYISNLYLPSVKNALAPTKAAEAATTTTERLRGVDNLKAAYNAQSANLSEAEKQIEALTEANRKLQQQLNRTGKIDQNKIDIASETYEPNFTRLGPSNFPALYNESKVNQAKKIASETPKQPVDGEIPEVVIEEPIEIPRAPINAEVPKQSEVPKQPETPPVNNEVHDQAPQNTSKKGFDWGYYLGFGSFKPEGGFGNKAHTAGKWLLNAAKLGGMYQVPAYVWDLGAQNNRRAEAEAQGKEYIETPTQVWNISPIGVVQNMMKAEVKQGQKYFKPKTKAPVEDDWLKQLDEAGKNVGY